MMEFEMSKSTMNKAKRIDKQIGETFKEYQERKRLEEQAALDSQKTSMEKSLALQSQKYERIREHERAAKKAMLYEDTVNVIGLTEMLTRVVEQSLLLDLDEYKRLNENYHGFIKSTINDFLIKADINENIDNENTLGLYECVQAHKPAKEVGVYLTEAEIQDQYDDLPYEVGEDYIEALSGDIMDRVATMVDADKKVAGEIDGNLNAIANVNESVMLRNEEDQKTVLEVLALNEATDMVRNGKEYNADLALANAITYVTILETLDASGLVKIGKEGYRNILEAAGAKATPKNVNMKKPVVLTENQETEVKRNVYQYTSRVEEARHAGFKSFSDWKKEKIQLTENVCMESHKDKDCKYEKGGVRYTRKEVEEYLTKQGFDLMVDDFDNIAHSMGFRHI